MNVIKGIWDILDGKKFYCVAFLVAVKGFLIFQADHNLINLVDSLIQAGAVAAGRSTLDKFLNQRADENKVSKDTDKDSAD